MTFTLPAALWNHDDEGAVRLLTGYFGPVVGEAGSYSNRMYGPRFGTEVAELFNTVSGTPVAQVSDAA